MSQRFRRGGFDEGMTKGQRHGDEGLAIGRKTMEPVYEFVRRCRGEGKPFFVWYAPMLPHDPHDPSQELVEHYSSKTESVHVARYWGNVERFDHTVGELLDFLDVEKLSADTLWEERLGDPESQARYERGEIELFDVAADPAETTNLAVGQPRLVRDLRTSLDAWWHPRNTPGVPRQKQ
ncbi:MAG: sulfatase-like hydrolase/transferase [Pirellulales bacterium]